jgi:RNA polymerase sigma-70 factor (ECF subfamily)
MDETLSLIFRQQSAQLVATLTRSLGSRYLALAEDAVQDALVTALQQWPYHGVPDRPEAWLYRVARNRALDRLRHAKMAADKGPAVAAGSQVEAPVDALLRDELPPVEDDQLGLMFLTCHPALPPESRVAFTLKLVGGFSVPEIARAFLAQEAAVAQRLVRAKRVLREQKIDFELPTTAAGLAARLDSVLESIYLMFNEGYAATAGDALVREDIAHEAIRLGRLVACHPATDVPRAWALVAMMCLHAARFPARASCDGELYLLRDQDRSRWDRGLVADGMRALDRASSGSAISAYHLEAGIAACHAGAPSWDATDWRAILALYDELHALSPSPVVALNRAIARSRVDGPLAGLADLEPLQHAPALSGYHLLPAVQAELWREAGDQSRAANCYREALARVQSRPERRFLATRLERAT